MTERIVHRWATDGYLTTRCGIVITATGMHGETFYNTDIEVRSGRLRHGERRCKKCLGRKAALNKEAK